MTGYRITNRSRFVTFVVMCIILFTVLVNGLLGLSTAQSATIQEYKEITVCSGDTLWSIADTYMSDSDVRKSVYELSKINNIKAQDLQAGMTILIPVENA